MKLGKETGSVTNHLLSGTLGAPAPVVGMGATILCWTDRHAGTIVKVTKTQVHVQEDTVTRVDTNGMSESQQYTYTPNPNGDISVFRLTKRGYRNNNGNSLRIGDRCEYHDYSF